MVLVMDMVMSMCMGKGMDMVMKIWEYEDKCVSYQKNKLKSA